MLLKRRIYELGFGIVLGMAFILIGALVPASDIANFLMICFGVVMVIVNTLSLVTIGLKDTVALVSAIIGILLGAAIIIYPSNIINIVIVLYLIVMPLLNIFYFKKGTDDNDLIKIILGIIFLLFTPFFIGTANAIIGVLLIIFGALLIVGSISGFVLLHKHKLLIKEFVKEEKKTDKDHIDYDFSDKK